MTRKTTLVLVLILALVAGVTSNASAQTTYKLDLSYAERSNFKLFGEVAADRPIGKLDLTIEKENWSVEFIAVHGLGDRDSGDPADYYDVIPSRLWERGDFSGSFDLEVFYAPSQLDASSATFISPMTTMSWKPNEHFSVEVGAQYVGTHHTEYGGDRLYGWVEPTLSHSVGRFSASVSPGFVAGDTGRTTWYVDGTVEVLLTESVAVYASRLEAKSWGMPSSPGVVPIDATWSFGATFTF